MVIFLGMLLANIVCQAAGGEAPNENNFFTYERLAPSAKSVSIIEKQEGIQQDIIKFARNYTSGVRLLQDGRTDDAEAAFLRARKFWPEFFLTDFALALIYEEKGDTNLAARYYRSYLDKLDMYTSGEYRYTGPVISVILGRGNVESHDLAWDLVSWRLYKMGIELEDVQPMDTTLDLASFFIPLIFVIVIVVAYFAIASGLAPYLKRRKRIKELPEGFWVCKYCGAITPQLSKVCAECGREREHV